MREGLQQRLAAKATDRFNQQLHQNLNLFLKVYMLSQLPHHGYALQNRQLRVVAVPW